MNWLAKIARTLFPRRLQIDRVPEQELVARYADLGIFGYDETGFQIACEAFTKRLAWTDITRIDVYKTDLLTVDRITMELVYGDQALTIHEDLPGWYQFVLKIKKAFPTIPQDWDAAIVQPAFAANYTTIYNRDETPPAF